MTDRELMQQVLEALEEEAAWFGSTRKGAAAIIALRERLAQPEQEFGFAESLAHRALPRREWQGLTEEDIQQVRENCGITHHAIKTIEAKLKEKNA